MPIKCHAQSHCIDSRALPSATEVDTAFQHAKMFLKKKNKKKKKMKKNEFKCQSGTVTFIHIHKHTHTHTHIQVKCPKN